jgi:ATP-binding cassette, subfamily B, bacterial CvaB/MchF/RaxB
MQILYQSERSECGLVALAMLASAYGLKSDLPSLRSRYPVSLKGMTLKSLMDVARQLDLDTRAVRCEVDDIDQLRLPAIIHWQMDHFVVLAKRSGHRFVIHDPAGGKLVIPRSDFDKKFTGVALEAWPGPKFKRNDQRHKLRLDAVISKNKELFSALIMIFILALGVEVVALILPILQEIVIDDALLTADADLLTLITIAMSIFLLTQAASSAIRGVVQRNLTSMLSMMVSARIFSHMVSLSTTWFERRSAAEVANRFESGKSIQQTLTTTVVNAGIDGIVAITALFAMVVYNARLAGIVVAAFVAYAVVRILWYSTYRQKSQGSLVANSKAQSLLWETMRGITTIKAVNGAIRRHNRYLATFSEYVRLQNGITTANIAFTFAHDLLFAAERVAILYFGAKAVFAHQFSVGMLTAFMSFRENFATKGTNLINAAVEFRLLSVHLDRLSDILLSPIETMNTLPYLGQQKVAGEVEMRDVSYRYGENEANTLEHCSLKVHAGEIVAIVGPSGAGKSTLFKILAGQAEPRTGDVIIDGAPLSSIGLERLRDVIAVVRQDDMLFAGTITENIAFLEEMPDHGRVRRMAALVCIDDEILRMPMGYNTLIGSMGTGLSGGQAQRIMLARALYRRPKILLLDEATSHLDLENERNISSAFRGLGITQIIIAHRPETIAKADRVVDIRNINHAF